MSRNLGQSEQPIRFRGRDKPPLQIILDADVTGKLANIDGLRDLMVNGSYGNEGWIPSGIDKFCSSLQAAAVDLLSRTSD